MPLFLHSRAASEDFERLVAQRLPKLPRGGLVHSFTGTMEEMHKMVALGLDIGVNGCSLKTEENLEVVRAMPLDRIQIETDGPWVTASSSFESDLTWLTAYISVKYDHPMPRINIEKQHRRCQRP